MSEFQLFSFPRRPAGFIGAALAVVTLGVAAVAQSATIPFANSFTTTGFSSGSGLTLNTGGTGTVTTTATGDTGAAVPVGIGTEQFSDSSNTSYTVSGQFFASSLGVQAGDQAATLTAFGLNGTASGGAAGRYLQAGYVFGQGSTNAGLLRLLDVGATTTTLAVSPFIDANNTEPGLVTVNTNYTLRLDVTNTGVNTYNLTLGLYDAAGTTLIGSAINASYAPSAAPVGGYYIGERVRLPNSSGTTTVGFDSFTVVPEPTTLAVLGLAGVLGLSRRRR